MGSVPPTPPPPPGRGSVLEVVAMSAARQDVEAPEGSGDGPGFAAPHEARPLLGGTVLFTGNKWGWVCIEWGILSSYLGSL